MSIAECPFVLEACYERAIRGADPSERGGIRRAFRKALRAAEDGDVGPAVLLACRYP